MPTIAMFRAADLFALLGVLGFVGYYTFLSPWWRESFGVTLVVKDIILGALLSVTALALFFNLTRLDNDVVAWCQLVLLFSVGAVLIWRTVVFGQLAVEEGRDWAPKWLRRRLDRFRAAKRSGPAD